MPERIKVKPAREGLLVRMSPAGRHIAADGETVSVTPWIQRRIYKGDLVIVSDTPPTRAAGKDVAK